MLPEPSPAESAPEYCITTAKCPLPSDRMLLEDVGSSKSAAAAANKSRSGKPVLVLKSTFNQDAKAQILVDETACTIVDMVS